MKMNDTVARIVEIMFQDVEKNEETDAIREEVMNNCQERYIDLVNSGVSEDDAIAAVIESLKGMDEILAPYKKVAQQESAEDDSLNDKQHLIFHTHLVDRIDLALVNEDVRIEASDDDCYHVVWDANCNPRLSATLDNGLLRIVREPGAEPKEKKSYFDMHKEDNADFVRTEDGKIEVNLNSINTVLKSIGDKVKLMISDRVKISVGNTCDSVTIQVPEKGVPHVKLLTTSGDIDIQDAALTDLDVTTTSGDIYVSLDETLPMERIEMRSTSGDIEITAYSDRAGVSSTSGDVDIGGRFEVLGIATISGDIEVDVRVKKINFSAISGDVDLTFDSNEIREVRGSTISGDIGIDLPDDLGTMAIQTRTRSGDVTTRYRANGVGPTVTGEVTSMSGDITIR